jgi:Asp-tRNA(Asn)/Glu-tRNA(Gln) amidotransferase A subunit family amidase
MHTALRPFHLSSICYGATQASAPSEAARRLKATTRDSKTLPRAPPNDGRPRFYTIADFHDAYKSGAVTPTDIVEALLPLIRRDIAQRGPHSTAFTESKVELVRQAAEASTKRWKAGKPLGILDGVPFAVKDDLDVTGYKRHCGTSRDYTEGRHVETSWCVRKVEEEGAVLIGKLNMHELGSGESSSIQLRLLGHHISLVHKS